MRKRNEWLLALSVGVFLLVAAGRCIAAGAGSISMEALLEDMTNLAGMAEFPNPPYTCKQFSSWDRGAKSPTENWFANGDCGFYLRTEDRAGRKEYVMAEMDGPGAIVRIWSANPAGTLRIYIDDAEQPALEAKMTDLLGGSFANLPKPVAVEVSKGWNLYLPIPYAKRCKVTGEGVAEKGYRMYYHVNYRTYPAGTPVVSFTMEQLRSLGDRIKAVAESLSDPTGAMPQSSANARMESTLAAGAKAANGLRLEGAGAIRRLAIRVDAADREAALRGVIMRISFDGQQTVEAPVGDFFGTAPGINPYGSLPMGVRSDGLMWSHWVMPYRQSAVISFQNTTKADAKIECSAFAGNHPWTDTTMLFHAKWRGDFDVPTRPMIDWNYLTAQGKGVFAGVAFAIDNPVKDWWGEGDEKIYVDGETFPSHFGTGTEDYYGYAWCWPGLFTHAYHNQTRCDGPNNYGRTSVNRWHILDRIPFTKDFKFDMELWHWHASSKVNMAVVAYWYARPGSTDAFRPVRAEDAIVRPMPKFTPPPVPKVAGAIEAESMKILRKPQGAIADPQPWEGLSNGQQLWWHNTPQPGDVLELAFNASKAGKYRVYARFIKAVDYGIMQLAVNGAAAGKPVDFFNDGVIVTKEMDLGVFELKQGENKFSATVVGANDKAVKGHMFGMDYLRLKAE